MRARNRPSPAPIMHPARQETRPLDSGASGSRRRAGVVARGGLAIRGRPRASPGSPVFPYPGATIMRRESFAVLYRAGIDPRPAGPYPGGQPPDVPSARRGAGGPSDADDPAGRVHRVRGRLGPGRPTAMEFAPDGRLFVLEQAGNVKLVRADGTHLDRPPPERRLAAASAACSASPSTPPSPRTITSTSITPTRTPARRPGPRASTTSSAGSPSTTPTRSQPVFTNEAPILDWNNLSGATNHNGGAIHFGLDGMLYADAGDNVQTFTPGRQHVPRLADARQPPGQAAPDQRRRVQQRRSRPATTPRSAT